VTAQRTAQLEALRPSSASCPGRVQRSASEV